MAQKISDPLESVGYRGRLDSPRRHGERGKGVEERRDQNRRQPEIEFPSPLGPFAPFSVSFVSVVKKRVTLPHVTEAYDTEFNLLDFDRVGLLSRRRVTIEKQETRL